MALLQEEKNQGRRRTMLQHMQQLRVTLVRFRAHFRVMNLDQRRADELAALLAVAREGSFVAAAAALQRHSTIISKRISTLEQRLGVYGHSANFAPGRCRSYGLRQLPITVLARPAVRAWKPMGTHVELVRHRLRGAVTAQHLDASRHQDYR